MKRILTAEAANYLSQGVSLDRPLPYELIRYNQKVFAAVHGVFVETFVVFKHKGKIKCAYVDDTLDYPVYERTREMRLELLLAGKKIVNLEEYENMPLPMPF